MTVFSYFCNECLACFFVCKPKTWNNFSLYNCLQNVCYVYVYLQKFHNFCSLKFCGGNFFRMNGMTICIRRKNHSPTGEKNSRVKISCNTHPLHIMVIRVFCLCVVFLLKQGIADPIILELACNNTIIYCHRLHVLNVLHIHKHVLLNVILYDSLILNHFPLV